MKFHYRIDMYTGPDGSSKRTRSGRLYSLLSALRAARVSVASGHGIDLMYGIDPSAGYISMPAAEIDRHAATYGLKNWKPISR